jgi:nuclear transcription Y subunit beta
MNSNDLGTNLTESEDVFKNDNDLKNTAQNEDSQNNDTYGAGDGSNGSEDEEMPHVLREQDRYLPIANVAKLMKKVIPERGKIAKEAKECVQEAVSEFISFITSEAAERCSLEKRKTVNGEDILYAMATLGFDNYIEPLKVYLQKYRETAKCETTNMTTRTEYSNEPNLGNYH